MIYVSKHIKTLFCGSILDSLYTRLNSFSVELIRPQICETMDSFARHQDEMWSMRADEVTKHGYILN